MLEAIQALGDVWPLLAITSVLGLILKLLPLVSDRVNERAVRLARARRRARK